MKLIWLRQAERDFEEAIDYIAPRNPDAALRLYEDIREGVGRLLEQPGMGRLGRVEGTRELVIYPYVVAYTVHIDVDAVVILRMLHGAQEWFQAMEDRKSDL